MINKINNYFFLSTFLLMIVIKPNLALTQTTDNEKLIEKTSEYLNNIDTLTSKFIQIDQYGNSLTGILFIEKPGKMRIEYDEPEQILIVVDGYYLIYVDKEIDQATYIDIDDTPAKYLLDPNWSFGSDEVEIYHTIADGDLISIFARPADKNSKEKIKFVFKDNPLELRQWEILDQKKKSITVTLYEVELNKELKSNLFKYEEYDLFDKD